MPDAAPVLTEVLCDIESVPLVIYCDYLTIDGVARLVAVTIEQLTVESPFEIHRILGEDEVFIIICKRNPLTIDVYLCTRDLIDYAMIVSFLKWSGFISLDVCR